MTVSGVVRGRVGLPKDETAADVVERVLLGTGGVLLMVAPFVRWTRDSAFGGQRLTGLLSATGTATPLAYAVLVLGAGLLFAALLARTLRHWRGIRIVLTLGILFVGGNLAATLVSAARPAGGGVTIGAGLPLAIAGICMLAGSVVAGFVAGRGRRGTPRSVWMVAAPLLVGVMLAGALVGLPLHARANTYCATPLSARAAAMRPLPSAQPPADIAARLQSDQQSVATAQAQQSADEAQVTQAQNEQDAADALQEQADQADSDAQSADDDVSSIQFDVDSDKDSISGDQGSISAANDAISSTQGMISDDQKWDLDPSVDEQMLSEYQSELSDAQAQLASDQAKLSSDQAKLGSAKQAAATAHQNAASLASQAADAATTAEQDAASAPDTSQDQTAVADAQAQLAKDQQDWKARHIADLVAVTVKNSDIRECRTQADYRLIASAILISLALASTGSALWRRRRAMRVPRLTDPPDTLGPGRRPLVR